jgi:hypothetical protein
MGRLWKSGNIIFYTPILIVGSPFLKIESFQRNAVACHELNTIIRTHTIRTHLTHTPIIILSTIITIATAITVTGGNKRLAYPQKRVLRHEPLRILLIRFRGRK